MFAYVYSKIVQNARMNARGAFAHDLPWQHFHISTLNYNPPERTIFEKKR